jgi:hypothetical protein
MAKLALKNRGDSVEREYADCVGVHFPSYERLWARHIVPLTYRVIDPDCVLVRANLDPNPELERMATGSYGTFLHLASCHHQLKSISEPELFAREGTYHFYSRLYSAAETVLVDFLPAVNEVLQKFKGPYIAEDPVTKGSRKWDRFKSRLNQNGHACLHHNFHTAFGDRVYPYRNQRVHRWGLPAVGDHIPGRKFVARWIGKGLGELARFRIADKTGDQFHAQFVPAVDQARDDIEFVERVLNDVWDMALRELSKLQDKDGYKKAQRVRSNDKVAPTGSPAAVVSQSGGASGWVPA